jgi:hypothetical protein
LSMVQYSFIPTTPSKAGSCGFSVNRPIPLAMAIVVLLIVSTSTADIGRVYAESLSLNVRAGTSYTVTVLLNQGDTLSFSFEVYNPQRYSDVIDFSLAFAVGCPCLGGYVEVSQSGVRSYTSSYTPDHYYGNYYLIFDNFAYNLDKTVSLTYSISAPPGPGFWHYLSEPGVAWLLLAVVMGIFLGASRRKRRRVQT